MLRLDECSIFARQQLPKLSCWRRDVVKLSTDSMASKASQKLFDEFFTVNHVDGSSPPSMSYELQAGHLFGELVIAECSELSTVDAAAR